MTGGKTKSGGIQRFKLSLHGDKHNLAAIVGYIQEDEPNGWFKKINSWIQSLDGIIGSDGESWSRTECLNQFKSDKALGVAQAWSSHMRIGNAISRNIHLRHLWVKM